MAQESFKKSYGGETPTFYESEFLQEFYQVVRGVISISTLWFPDLYILFFFFSKTSIFVGC